MHLLTGPESQETSPATAAAPGSATPSAAESASKCASPSPKRSASPSAKPSTDKKKPKKKAKKQPTKKPSATPVKTRPTGRAEAEAAAPDPAPAAPNGAAEQVVALVNTERAKAGCGPVRSNGRLATAATKHSADMAARDYFDHTSPDGTDPGDRITAAGYRWSTYGENIARGQRTPASVMDSWMNSAGHRANILNCDYKELGVGIHNASGGPWWTQAFGHGGLDRRGAGAARPQPTRCPWNCSRRRWASVSVAALAARDLTAQADQRGAEGADGLGVAYAVPEVVGPVGRGFDLRGVRCLPGREAGRRDREPRLAAARRFTGEPREVGADFHPMDDLVRARTVHAQGGLLPGGRERRGLAVAARLDGRGDRRVRVGVRVAVRDAGLIRPRRVRGRCLREVRCGGRRLRCRVGVECEEQVGGVVAEGLGGGLLVEREQRGAVAAAQDGGERLHVGGRRRGAAPGGRGDAAVEGDAGPRVEPVLVRACQLSASVCRSAMSAVLPAGRSRSSWVNQSQGNPV